MDEIYSRAMQVNVHLGEGDEGTGASIESVKRVAAASITAMQAKKVRVGKGIMSKKYDKVAEELLRKLSIPDLLEEMEKCMRT
jgi:hypothetical protein